MVPIVLAHARALLASAPEGTTAYINTDLREPGQILASPELRATLDLDRSVMLIINGTLHFFPDDDQIYGVVRELVGALAPGSLLALQHATADAMIPESADRLVKAQNANGIPFRLRSQAEFGRFFEGLELLPPGIELMAEWRPDDDPATRPAPLEASAYAAVGRKP
jgi:hypothetical protein